MTRNELRDLLIEGRELLDRLKDAWLYLEDAEIVAATEIQHLPCDACEEVEDGD